MKKLTYFQRKINDLVQLKQTTLINYIEIKIGNMLKGNTTVLKTYNYQYEFCFLPQQATDTIK